MRGRYSIFWQIVLPYLVVTGVAVFGLMFYAANEIRSSYDEWVRENLQVAAVLLEPTVAEHVQSESGKELLRSHCAELVHAEKIRVTIIDLDGVVLGDSREDPAQMGNHANRLEVKQGYAGQVGFAMRKSPTLRVNMIYVAQPVMVDGKVVAVLRTAMPTTAAENDVALIRERILVGAILITLLALVVGVVISRRITEPLEKMCKVANTFALGDFSARVPLQRSEEISDLAEALNRMAEELGDQVLTIHEQRDKLESVLSSMQEGVLAVDSEGHLLLLNRAARSLLELGDCTVAGETLEAVLRSGEMQSFVREALAVQVPVEGDLQLFRGEESLSIHLTGSPLSGGAAVPGALVVLHDVTHIQRLETVRRDFVANVSHELKTPITSIKGFVETLLETPPDDEETKRKFLGIVGRQSERLNSIVEDLLSLARIEAEAESKRIDCELQSLLPVVEAAIQTCGLKARKKNMDVVIEGEASIEAAVNGPLLEQALVNLIDNAIKYSPEGSEVVCRIRTTENGIFLDVVDHGVGIPQEALDRLFERFYRVDKARSRELGGTGLGLAIVKHIAKAHGGTVRVLSEVGRGSTFSIILEA